MYFSDKRECSMVVCKNDAACQEIEGDYSCSCKEGFAGKNCDRGKTFYFWIRPIPRNLSKIPNNFFAKILRER